MRNPVPLGCFWAKLSDDRSAWHSLAGHSADVGAVADQLLSPESALAARLAVAAGLRELPELHRAWLVRLACLHDIGKVNRRFQSRKHLPRRAYLELGGHVKVVIDSPTTEPPVSTVLTALGKGLHHDGLVVLHWFRTAVSHHGRPWGAPSVTKDVLWSRCWAPGDSLDPPAQVKHLLRLSSRWSGAKPGMRIEGGMPSDPAFTHLFAGILTLADWIASTELIFKLKEDAADRDPDGYWADARDCARRACARIGVVPETRPVQVNLTGLPLLERIFPKLFGEQAVPGSKRRLEPTPLQTAAATMPLPTPGSAVLIESETGSGKTEAVLVLYARMRAAGLVSGLFFALPTRATARAMYTRVEKALQGIYPDGPRPSVALAIGGLSPHFDATDDAVKQRPDTHDDDVDRRPADPDTLLAHWAASNAKKFLAAEIVVGTVDQALLAGLPVRHAHLRLVGLARHLLVVDELHSFDRYMNRILVRLLEIHAGAGGCAAFMSATLSSAARAELEGSIIPLAPRRAAEKTAYPALWIRPQNGTWELRDLLQTRRRNRPKRIVWEPVDEKSALVEAVAAARAGARVCILRNTVKDARRTVAELTRSDGPAEFHGAADQLWRPVANAAPPPYHSRYTVPDRAVMDKDVVDRFGPDAAGADNTARNGGCLLVATQVVEQSLDVDFDFFITDLCPIDALLQRLGRLHRHRKRDKHRPPGYKTARALVIAPADGFLQWAREEHEQQRRGPHGWGTVYDDLGDLELTLHLLRQRPRVEIPRHNRSLIEAVYHPESRSGLDQDIQWEAYSVGQDGRRVARDRYAEDTRLPFEYGYTSAEVVHRFDSAEEARVRTRLGDDTVRIELPGEVRGWYCNETVRHVDLPLRALFSSYQAEDGEVIRDSDSVGAVTDFVPQERGASFRVGETRVVYQRDGWVWSRGDRSDPPDDACL
jgi:CRISPR-associated endonuclease/helicase Cas3